jgi:integrase
VRLLRASKTRSALAFEWLILTATRSGETRGATWAEIDENMAVWTIPPKRMKMKRAHQIPLPPRCLEILGKLRSTYPAEPHHVLFLCAGGRPMSDMTLTKLLRDWGLADKATVHGFRSSFKDWCAEVAKARDEVSEAALAHSVSGSVRAAYLRTEFLEEPITLMQRWEAHCTMAVSI